MPIGVPERIRTSDPQCRKRLLYPAELRALTTRSAARSSPQSVSANFLVPHHYLAPQPRIRKPLLYPAELRGHGQRYSIRCLRRQYSFHRFRLGIVYGVSVHQGPLSRPRFAFRMCQTGVVLTPGCKLCHRSERGVQPPDSGSDWIKAGGNVNRPKLTTTARPKNSSNTPSSITKAAPSGMAYIRFGSARIACATKRPMSTIPAPSTRRPW